MVWGADIDGDHLSDGILRTNVGVILIPGSGLRGGDEDYWLPALGVGGAVRAL